MGSPLRGGTVLMGRAGPYGRVPYGDGSMGGPGESREIC